MKKYPKFLNILPEVYGLSFYELAALMISLYIALILSFSPLVTIITALLLIILTRFIRKHFDLVGFLSKKEKSLSFKNLMRDKE